jgi:hypothetical protein
MSNKMASDLVGALIVGTASTALARGSYGRPVHPWQDIAQDSATVVKLHRRLRGGLKTSAIEH